MDACCACAKNTSQLKIIYLLKYITSPKVLRKVVTANSEDKSHGEMQQCKLLTTKYIVTRATIEEVIVVYR